MSRRAMKKATKPGPGTKPYDVGYGRPPVHSRYKKGRSGNPKGRPKGAKSMKALLEEALSSSVTIVENGAPKKTELRSIIFRTLCAKAAKGDARSTAVVVNLMQQFGLAQPDGSVPNQPLYIVTGVPRSKDE